MDTFFVLMIVATWDITNYPRAININPVPMPSMEVCEQQKPWFEKMVFQEFQSTMPLYTITKPGIRGVTVKAECRSGTFETHISK